MHALSTQADWWVFDDHEVKAGVATSIGRALGLMDAKKIRSGIQNEEETDC